MLCVISSLIADGRDGSCFSAGALDPICDSTRQFARVKERTVVAWCYASQHLLPPFTPGLSLCVESKRPAVAIEWADGQKTKSSSHEKQTALNCERSFLELSAFALRDPPDQLLHLTFA